MKAEGPAQEATGTRMRSPYLPLGPRPASLFGRAAGRPETPEAVFIRGVHVGQVLGGGLLAPDDVRPCGETAGLGHLAREAERSRMRLFQRRK